MPTDSPLSTTSSILAILTFALGVFGFYLALYSSTRSAPADIEHLVADLRSTQAEINRVSEWIFDGGLDTVDGGFHNVGAWRWDPQQHQQLRQSRDVGEQRERKGGEEAKVGARGVVMEANRAQQPASRSRDQALYDEVQMLLRGCIGLFYAADGMLKRSEKEGKGLWRRVVFLLNRDEVRETMNRLQEQKTRLAAIQMSLFLRKNAAQDVVLKRILAYMEGHEAFCREKEHPEWMLSIPRK